MKIFAIVVTYNAMPWINKCLKSIENCSLKVNTLVIDNCSTDETLFYIENNFPSVDLIKNERNLGFGKANNIGLNIALEHSADYVLLLNQDAWLLDGALAKMIESFEQDANYWIVSPIFFQTGEKTFENHFQKYAAHKYCPDLLKDLETNSNGLQNLYPIQFIHAACWLLNKKTLQEVGGFDPVFPHRGEDNDFLNRVKFKQGKIGICPKAKIIHDNASQGSPENLWPVKKLTNHFYVTLLHSLKNINKPFVKQVIFVQLYFIKVSAYSLLRFNLKTMRCLGIAYLKHLIVLFRIVKHRTLSKQKMAFLTHAN